MFLGGALSFGTTKLEKRLRELHPTDAFLVTGSFRLGCVLAQFSCEVWNDISVAIPKSQLIGMQRHCTPNSSVLYIKMFGKVHTFGNITQEDSWVMPPYLWLSMSFWPQSKLCSFLQSHDMMAAMTVLAGTCYRSPLCESPTLTQPGRWLPKGQLEMSFVFHNITVAQKFSWVQLNRVYVAFPLRHFLSEEARRQWRNGVTHDNWSLP